MAQIRDWKAWGAAMQEELCSAFPSMKFDTTTVVICCKDKAHVLPLVLAALDNQIVRADRWILADDHSSDNSVALFQEFCSTRGISHDFRQPDRKALFQLNTLRNLGFEAAEDGLVIVIDGDLIVGPGFVQAHQRLHTKSSGPASSVGPLFEAADDRGSGPINYMWGHESWAHISHPSDGTVPTWATVLGGNLGLHRETWRLLGGFDPAYDGNYGVDDQDMHYRLNLAGVRHVGDFHAHVIHLPHDNVLGASRSPQVNLNKFREKYGFSLYSRSNVPDQIDWLGWAHGPWNRVARRLLEGDVSAATTRGAHIAYTNPSAVRRKTPINERTIGILRQIFDPPFVRRQVPTTVNDTDLFYAFLTDADFKRTMPNLYFDPSYIEMQLGSNLAADEHLSAIYIEKGLFESVGPHPVFQPAIYSRMHASSIPDKVVPFIHFWTVGRQGELSPNPLIDLDFYASKLSGRPSSESPTADHLFSKGAARGTPFSPYFDIEYYDHSARRQGTNTNWALAHFYGTPPGQRVSPNPGVSFHWYRQTYGSSLDGLDPLTHFLLDGASRGFRPSPFVDGNRFRSMTDALEMIICDAAA